MGTSEMEIEIERESSQLLDVHFFFLIIISLDFQHRFEIEVLNFF